MNGCVVKSTGSWYEVRTEDGETKLARARGKLRLSGHRHTNPIAVGDQVVLMEDKGVLTIAEIKPRRNYLIRKSVNLSKETHIIGANIDQAIIVISLVSPPTSHGFVDRFIASCEAYEVPVILIFNKVDLYGEKEQEELAYRMAVYQNIGYTCLQTSVPTLQGLTELKALLQNKLTLLGGHSGVGKSSLVNILEPTLQLKTGQVSDYHQKGQHTTTFAEMHPLSFGGDIIDSPGIKGFGLVDMKKEEISSYFKEIFEASNGCKYNNCMHIEEPGCAIHPLVESGEIAITRYNSYLSLLEENQESSPYR